MPGNRDNSNVTLLQNKQKFLKEAKDRLLSFDEELLSKAWEIARRELWEIAREERQIETFSANIEVARILFSINCDSITIVSALLQNVKEHGDLDLRTVFGQNIANLVKNINKLAQLDSPDKAWIDNSSHREDMQRLVIAIANDPRVALVKLANRIRILNNLGANFSEEQNRRAQEPGKQLSAEQKRNIAQESLEVFAPIAEGLEISTFQNRIQDLAFRHMEPEKYQEVENKLKEKQKQFKNTRKRVVNLIEKCLREINIDALVYGRQKEVYSTYQKMQSMGLAFDFVYDIIGIRVITDDSDECYTAAAAISQLGQEEHHELIEHQDYIQRPRGPFRYQSIHKIIRLNDPKDALIEIQIRSKEMHEYAERGPAAHWIYKMGGTSPDQAFIKKLNVLRERWAALLESRSPIQEEDTDDLELQIHVYSPRGDVVTLPYGSTPLDFAYHIHTQVGHECRSAYVNDKNVPLKYELHDGDKVEIITRRGSAPKLSWITEGKVKSKRAQLKIRQYFQSEKYLELVAQGRDIAQKQLKEFSNIHLVIDELVFVFIEHKILNKAANEDDFYAALASKRIQPDKFKKAIGELIVARCLNESRLDKKALGDLALIYRNEGLIPVAREEVLFSAVATGEISLKHLTKTIRELEAHPLESLDISPPLHGKPPVIHDVAFHTAKCCYALPGDEIIGFVTVGQGIAVHRTMCHQLNSLTDQRCIAYSWPELGVSTEEMFKSKVLVRLSRFNAEIYTALQRAVTKEGGEFHESAKNISAKWPILISLIIEVKSVQHLKKILARVEQIKGVIEALRYSEVRDVEP